MGDDLGDLVLVGEHLDRGRLLDHELADRPVRGRDDEVAQREHAAQALLVVDDVDVVDRLRVGLQLAQPGDGLVGRELLAHGHELGGHDAAGRVLGIAEQLGHLVGLLAVHERQDLVPGRVREVGDEVGRVVGAHLLEDVRRPLGLEVLEDLDLRLGLHLLDGVGRRLVVEDGQDAGPVARCELVDDRGQVGRVQLLEAGMRHAQADRGDGGLDRVDVLPVDVALGDRQPQVARDRPIGPLDAQPAQQAGGARRRRPRGGACPRSRRGAGR